MLVTSVVCWIVVKTKIRGRWLIDNLASLPMVFPGMVLGLAIMISYLKFEIGVYGTLSILFIAYVTRFLMTSMMQIHQELEESAAMSGASVISGHYVELSALGVLLILLRLTLVLSFQAVARRFGIKEH